MEDKTWTNDEYEMNVAVNMKQHKKKVIYTSNILTEATVYH